MCPLWFRRHHFARHPAPAGFCLDNPLRSLLTMGEESLQAEMADALRAIVALLAADRDERAARSSGSI